MNKLLLPLLLLLLVACPAPPPPEEKFDQYFALEGSFAGSHILIAYKGASGSAPDLQRSREEALTKAGQLAEALREEPSLFGQLALDESDGPEADRAGYLGVWNTGDLIPVLEEAFRAMEPDSIRSEPIETPFGFHLLRREPLCIRHYGYESFIIAFKGSEETPAAIRRDRETAKVLADKVAGKLNHANFEKLAHTYNDFAEGPSGLEVVTERDPLPDELAAACSELPFGQVTGPLELPVGFAFFRKVKLEPRAGSHILISFREAADAPASIQRTREEAETRISNILEELAGDPSRFAQLAKAHSDAPDATGGGSLGIWYRGRMTSEFEAAMDDLAAEAISTRAVETRFGFHIIQRRTAPQPCR